MMTDLELIQDKLLTAYNIPTEFVKDNTCLEGSNDTLMVFVASALEKNDNKWFVRFIPKVSYVCWETASYIQDVFDSAQELLWSLDHTESDIYKTLFELLSELYEEYEQDTEKHGEWIIGMDGSYMCSKCEKVFRYEIGNYCSNCGTKLVYKEE